MTPPVQWARPAAPLSAFVSVYWAVDYRAGADERTPYLPGAAIAWIFGMQGGAEVQLGAARTTQPRAFVKGVLSETCIVHSAGHTANVGVAFLAGGASLFHDAPMEAYRGGLIDLEAVEQSGLSDLARRIDPRAPFRDNVALLDRWLLRRLARSSASTVGAQLTREVHERRIWDLPTLTERAGYSSRQLRRIFQREVGTSPKQFLRLARIRSAASMIRGGATSLADVAFTHGYFDQAHFTHDFKALLGRTPTQYLAGTPGLAGHFE